MFCSLSSHVIQSLTFKQKCKNKLLQKHIKIQQRLKIKNDIALKKCNLMYGIYTNTEECKVIWDDIKVISQEYIENKEDLIMLKRYNFISFIIYKVCKSFNT